MNVARSTVAASFGGSNPVVPFDVPRNVLFLNEGALGGAVVGHVRVEHALREASRDWTGIDPEFIQLSPPGRVASTAMRGVPYLSRLDLDLQRTRWHLVQAIRARITAERAVRRRPADRLHVSSHSIGLLLGSLTERIPTFLSVDTTIREWEHMAVWRPVRPWTDVSLAASYAAERRMFRNAAGVIAWTRWTAESVLRECPDIEVHEIHPGVDISSFTPAPRAARDRFRLLFVGGRFEEKGGATLLEALRPLLGTEVDLDVVTNAPLEPQPGVRVHRLGAGDPELIRLFQQADLLCLPTRADAVPFVVVEAMACATPVLSTPVGAIPELIGGDEAGVIVPVGDAMAMRAAVEGLLRDPERLGRLGAAGRARAERLFDSRIQSAELAEVLGATAP